MIIHVGLTHLLGSDIHYWNSLHACNAILSHIMIFCSIIAVYQQTTPLVLSPVSCANGILFSACCSKTLL